MAENSVCMIFERMKSVINARTDKELREELGAYQSTFSNWKNRNSLPLDVATDFAQKHSVDLNWLLLGRNVEDPQRDQLTTMALEELVHLNDQQKFKVVSFIKALREEGNSLHAHNQFNQNNIGVVAEQIHQPIKQTFK